jgi:DNA-directed RNA polymerase specialized sigma24 family protein
MSQTSKPGLKQNGLPTESAFRKFLAWLDGGQDSRGEKYLDMRGRLVRYFDRRNCFPADDLADETLNRVARRLEEEGTISEGPPARYCYIVAKFVLLEHVRGSRPQVSAEESEFKFAISSATRVPSAATPETEQMLEHLEHCLDKLVSGDRDLILGYYRGELREKIQQRRELAERLGLTTNALSIRACRIRDRLEDCVRRCTQGGTK